MDRARPVLVGAVVGLFVVAGLLGYWFLVGQAAACGDNIARSPAGRGRICSATHACTMASISSGNRALSHVCWSIVTKPSKYRINQVDASKQVNMQSSAPAHSRLEAKGRGAQTSKASNIRKQNLSSRGGSVVTAALKKPGSR